MTEVIIALDFSTWEETEAFLQQFPKGEALFVKVGMELFYKEGPQLIEKLQQQGHRIFLDLKLHDIPNTVERAMRNLGRLGVSMTNVHAAGGKKMMQAAKRGLTAGAKEAGFAEPLLIAVTQLTSTSEAEMQAEQHIALSMKESVLAYAQLTKEASLDGVVCSAQEASVLHQKLGENFQTVCPGIRLLGDQKGDQQRVVTPKQAQQQGADYIVVGRSITQALAPYQVYQQIMQEVSEEK